MAQRPGTPAKRKLRNRACFYATRARRKLTRTVLPFLFLVTTFFVMLASVGFYYFEIGMNPNVRSYWDALWMSFVVIVPAASRAVAPLSVLGRLISVMGIVLGIGFLGLFTATLATGLVELVLKGGLGLSAFKCEGHVLICGWSPRGSYLLEELSREVPRDCPVVVLAQLAGPPSEDDRVLFVRGEQTSFEDLDRANAAGASSVLLLADEAQVERPGDADARTVLAAFSIRQLNQSAKIVAEVLVKDNLVHMRNAGVTEVLVSNRLMGHALARSAFEYGTISVVSQLLSAQRGRQIYTTPLPELLEGVPYGEAVGLLQRERGQTLIAVERDGETSTNPEKLTLRRGDRLFVLAPARPEVTE